MEFKRLFVICAVAMILTVQVRAAPEIHWASDSSFTLGLGPDLWDWNDNPIPQTSTFAVQLLRMSDKSVLYTAANTWWSIEGKDGVGYDTIPSTTVQNDWNGIKVITRIYDNANPLSAGRYADTPEFTISWSDTPSPAASIEYNIGTISSTTWQVIPEPMTGMMLAMCAAVYGLKRLGRARQRG